MVVDVAQVDTAGQPLNRLGGRLAVGCSTGQADQLTRSANDKFDLQLQLAGWGQPRRPRAERRVADAEAALRAIEHDGIDLVFSDIVMPGKMDGLALAHRLRQIRPGLPILLATGYSDAAVNVRGDFPILRKPYEIHELSQAIARLPR